LICAYWSFKCTNSSSFFANAVIAPAAAAFAAGALMGRWGLRSFAWAYGLSWLAFLIYCVALLVADGFAFTAFRHDVAALRVPWALNGRWSLAFAWLVIGGYLALNAVFLQPYLGDAARYFRGSPANVAVRREIRRQAVQTLEELHKGGLYDRIVVVAHSLGTVVAYDMLRAYYGRVCDTMPMPTSEVAQAFDELDGRRATGNLPRAQLRDFGRRVIASIEAAVASQRAAASAVPDKSAEGVPPAWLVTDFVTLGSPLTHAAYLMCTPSGGAADTGIRAQLRVDFLRRVEQREFPICPPKRLDQDGLLTFGNPRRGGARQFHHGGLFALTRWTNLYFRNEQLFWGDAIGGIVGGERLGELFGRGIVDVAVWTAGEQRTSEFFTHTAYWATSWKGKSQVGADCLLRLRQAINLAERPHFEEALLAEGERSDAEEAQLAEAQA
jgi:hypothetical protein